MAVVARPPAAGRGFTLLELLVVIVLAGILFMLRRIWLQFRERMIEPAVIEAQETLDHIDARADRAKAGISGWFQRTFQRK